MKKLLCATLEGNKAKEVCVEAVFTRALPCFSIVGLASQSINESKDRVKAALLNIDFKFPAQKITLNLSPADLKKEGSHFDLAFAVLIALQKENISFEDYFIFGELGLDGSIKSTANLFSLLLSLASLNKTTKKIIAPFCIAKNLSMIPNLEVYGFKNILEVIDFFKNEDIRKNYLFSDIHPLFKNCPTINGKSYVFTEDFHQDFYDIKGQKRAKRAALISVSGMHNILFEGSPGCGKSMTIKRMQYIMPPLSVDEILQISSYRSLNQEECDFIPLRPFRSPHHSSTKASIFGGGAFNAKLGEVALAHNGILFFDEFPHFSKQILESLREPLEDKQVLISRVNTKITYKTNFLFAAACNPCPCGNLFSYTKTCKCNDIEIKRYKTKISAPLLDRIDLYVQMDETNPNDEQDVSSKQMYEKVLDAFYMQKNRNQNCFNGSLEDKDIKKFCKIDNECKNLLTTASIKHGLSQRAINKTLKVSRTIADLEKEENISKHHLLESLSFRIRLG